MLKYLTMIQDRKKVMNPNMLQAIAKQFEAAYIQNGGLFLAMRYDAKTDYFVLDTEYDELRRKDFESMAKEVNAAYGGYKLALVVQAAQSIAQ
jgi:hypothetical protein